LAVVSGGWMPRASSFRMSSWRFLRLVALAVLGTLPTASANLPPKNSPGFRMLACEACTTVIGRLSKDVKHLIETKKMWTQPVLEERLAASCADPLLPKGAGNAACGVLIQDYGVVISKEVAKRWDEDAEEFEEDLVAKDFCSEKVDLCRDGSKTISQMLSESEVREKALKQEKDEKEAAKAR
ncbi:unnamed protein product, partial [Polarella glacialis]